MVKFSTKKSDISVEASFSGPAFDLLKPESALHEKVTERLAEFCQITGDDIRLNRDAVPLSNASVTYALAALDGAARVSIDKAQIAFFNAHLLRTEQIASSSLALLNAVSEVIPNSSYQNFVVRGNIHCVLEGVEPLAHTSRYVSPVPEGFEKTIGNAVMYYFGQEGPRSYSSVGVDMSGEFSDCVYVTVAIGYDSTKIGMDELPEPVIQHYNQLLSVIGFEPEQ